MQGRLTITVHAIAACTHHERCLVQTVAVDVFQHIKQDIRLTQELHSLAQ